MSGRILILIAVTLLFLAVYGYAVIKCPECGAELPDDANFYSYCRSDLLAPKVICEECGAENEPGAEVCIECGAALPAVEYIECPGCSAVLPADAESCDTCGAKFPGFVWEIDFGGWTEGPETGVEMVGSEVYKIEEGHLIMGDGDGRGEEMRAGFTVDLSDFEGFNISGKFSIPKREGGQAWSSLGFGHTSTGNAIKIMLIGGKMGYGLWAGSSTKEYIIKEEGAFFKGIYNKGFLESNAFRDADNILFKGFNLKSYWEDQHGFSFTMIQGETTMRVDDESFDLPSLPTTDVKLFISVYDDLIAEVWDLRVEALP